MLRLEAQRVMRSFAKRVRHKQPCPHDWFGEEIRNDDRLKNRKAWFPTGSLIEDFTNSVRPDLDHALEGAGLTAKGIFLNLYLCGRSKEEAEATIFVSGTKDPPLKQYVRYVRDYLEDKNLTRAYNVGVGSWPLEVKGPISNVTSPRQSSRERNTRGANSWQSNSSSSHELETQVYSSDQPLRAGSRLYLAKAGDAILSGGISYNGTVDPDMSRATAGPFLELDNQLFLLSVGHIGDQSMNPDQSHEICVDDIFDAAELDRWLGEDSSQGCAEHIENGHAYFDVQEDDHHNSIISGNGSVSIFDSALSKPALDSKMAVQPDAPAVSIDGRTATMDRDAIHHIHSVGPLTFWGSRLDWILIRFDAATDVSAELYKNELVRNGRTLRFDTIATIPNKDCPVLILSSRSLQEGSLKSSMTLAYYSGTSSHRLGIVRLERGAIQAGDSGSLVIDRTTGAIYGHLIKAESNGETAYIAPMEDIVEEIKLMTGHTLSLSIHTDLRHEILDEKHPNTISSIADLAITYHDQVKYAEADETKLDVPLIEKDVKAAVDNRESRRYDSSKPSRSG
ncbi:hypothetical protein PG985_008728 [Apiospora marii]|uniref:uncharacterized protein n=1 Tax=Apiospora marii TaxID=335849 RepID=UPI0031300509